MDVEDTLAEIREACRSMAGLPYDGEPVDQLAHALQAAALAGAAGADDELLVGALLHDIARAPAVAGVHRDEADQHHGALGSAWLTPRVGARVAWLAEQHVAAKRYLVAVDDGYRDALSPTSVETLAGQGGPMDATEVAAAEADPDWPQAVALRRWDDAAKVAGAEVPDFERYEPVLRRLIARAQTATDGAGSRAVVFDGPGLPLRLEHLAIPAPGPGELVVRITATTLCGSDLSSFVGRREVAVPTVLGHESVGLVEASGPGTVDADGRALAPGTRVTWTITTSCERCPACRAGRPQKCAHLIKYGHEPLGRVAGPAGGLADRVLLPAGTTVVAVPDALPDAVAAPASCATATIAGALRVAGLRAGESVVITGLGMLGLTACAMAASAGAHVIGVDVVPERVALAARFGAARTLLLEDAAGAIADADVLLELSGNPATTASGLGWLAVGGRAVLVGAVHPGEPIALDGERVVRRLLRIEGLHNYTPVDLRTAVAFLAGHGAGFPFAALVASEHPLAEAEEAFTAAAGGALRVLVRP